MMALLGDAALNLLHQPGLRQIAAQLRFQAQHPEHAVALVVTGHLTHALALTSAASDTTSAG